MLELDFLPSIDNFRYSGGKYPLLICGTHAYSEGTPSERQKHTTDFAVQPILEKLRAFHEFHIIENLVPRRLIDMNREEARNKDTKDENDFLYRQMIRFMCEILAKNYKKPVIVIDLHSFPPHDVAWGNPDFVIALQMRKGAITNPSLVNYTEHFFRANHWELIASTIHNPDDIVEEIALRKLGIPLLLEINEKCLNNAKRMGKLVQDFRTYLLSLNSFNVIALKQTDQAERPLPSLQTIENQKKTLPLIIDSPLKRAFDAYLTSYEMLVQSKTPVIAAQGDKDTLSSIDIANIDSAEDSNAMTLNAIHQLSQFHDTIIIPIELFLLYSKIVYARLNRLNLEEWGLNVNAMLRGLVQLTEKSPMQVVIPHFTSDLYARGQSLFQSYQLDNSSGFLNYLISFHQLPNISADAKTKDLQFLKRDLGVEIDTTNPKTLEKVAKEIEHRSFQVK